MITKTSNGSVARGTLLCGLLATTLPLALAGCGSNNQQAQAPVQPVNRQANPGMSMKQKGTLLVGAAAMYFLYRKFQRDNAAKLANQKIQYYISKSTGRIYYRDPKTKQAVWVTPPPSQVQPQYAPTGQEREYQGIQGYNNVNSGRALTDLPDFQVQ